MNKSIQEKVPANRLASRVDSFRFASRGILKFFREEPNARIHFVATVLLIVAALYFPLSRMELVVLTLATGAVWTAELFNTAIERVMDFMSPQYNPKIEFIKDVSAGAVLVTAVAALATGAIIFIPKIF